ncbi:MAG TPA: pyridoxal phosphate-dependent aminotransferase family protein, partial [Verrucomicrobiae bacterium]
MAEGAKVREINRLQRAQAALPDELPPALRQIDPTHVLHGGRKLIYFGGCDYFRLSWHPKIRRALVDGLAEHGLNVAASRITTGNHPIYSQLERALELFFRCEKALLLGNGYMTNLAVVQGVRSEITHALIDEQAHASLQDAAQLLERPVRRFAHGNPVALLAALRSCGPKSRPLVLTEGFCAQDSTIAPISDYLLALPKSALVLMDDAHGVGTLGATARGAAELLYLDDPRVICTMTLSKAFGVYGGAILSSSDIIKKIVQRSRLFQGHTPLPPPMAAAALAAVHILSEDIERRERLERNINHVHMRLAGAGHELPKVCSPIITMKFKTEPAKAQLKKALLRAGIYPSFIHYPSGP